MPVTKRALAPLSNLLPADLALGEPTTAGALTVFPLLGESSRLEYLSFAEASARGFSLRELDTASVNDLLAVNGLDVPVLLYEGEEVKGAQQDRTIDVPVLVGAGAKVRVPVSCVEHGRWDGRRHAEPFTPSPQAAYPELRARKATRSRAAMAAGAPARADQQEVWAEVAAMADRHGAAAPTGAMGSIYEDRDEALAALECRFARTDGQLGALACILGRPKVLDLVSRSDVFAALWPPLLRGYCLDALDSPEAAATTAQAAASFLAEITASQPSGHPAIGLGTLATWEGAPAGTGLVHEGEIVQLSAFA